MSFLLIHIDNKHIQGPALYDNLLFPLFGAVSVMYTTAIKMVPFRFQL